MLSPHLNPDPALDSPLAPEDFDAISLFCALTQQRNQDAAAERASITLNLRMPCHPSLRSNPVRKPDFPE